MKFEVCLSPFHVQILCQIHADGKAYHGDFKDAQEETERVYQPKPCPDERDKCPLYWQGEKAG